MGPNLFHPRLALACHHFAMIQAMFFRALISNCA